LSRAPRVVIADNRFLAGSNHPITLTDRTGDTYQRRALTDGKEYEILRTPLRHVAHCLAGRAHAAVVRGSSGQGGPRGAVLPAWEWSALQDLLAAMSAASILLFAKDSSPASAPT